MYLSPFSFCIYKIGITYKPILRQLTEGIKEISFPFYVVPAL